MGRADVKQLQVRRPRLEQVRCCPERLEEAWPGLRGSDPPTEAQCPEIKAVSLGMSPSQRHGRCVHQAWPQRCASASLLFSPRPLQGGLVLKVAKPGPPESRTAQSSRTPPARVRGTHARTPLSTGRPDIQAPGVWSSFWLTGRACLSQSSMHEGTSFPTHVPVHVTGQAALQIVLDDLTRVPRPERHLCPCRLVNDSTPATGQASSFFPLAVESGAAWRSEERAGAG